MPDPADENSAPDGNCSPDISSDGLKNVNSEDGLVCIFLLINSI